MRILVVGGLGYLGSILVDLLTIRGAEVDILDTTLWSNDNLKQHVKHKNFYTETGTIEETEKGVAVYDHIVWAAHIDLFSFYNMDETSLFRLKQMQTFERVLSWNKPVLNLSTFHMNYIPTDSQMYHYFLTTEEMALKKGCQSLRMPILYGASPRMRWDTLVNEMMFSTIIRNVILLQEDINVTQPIAHVVDAAEFIIGFLFKQYNSLPLVYCTELTTPIVMAHQIAANFKNCEVKLVGNDFHIWNYGAIQTVRGLSTIKSACDVIKKNIELETMPDFGDDRFNNQTMINNALSSSRLAEILLGT
jgi:nucleoside-diphosphate-sugar epimerase